ncbi:glycogen synthesis protein GlgS [Salmonella enterica]|jgi:hypothetical protein|uniref:glycogen synthesis protein GlgS n=1 Tax=Enterobacterales TaxID=91347 RepID=UPI00069F282A|nr:MULTISPECIES: glycogen synthesis protein GlgS [Enterobacterales]EAZ6366622.1 glycogen synthesis protein GlgS [Salmonella enterica]EDC0921280.1 glycogen synthesis protein GlgS [Salmonella enterica subsp. enterica serovar Montevideo]EDL7998726.1 glycogen synthesis protein GlgS [Salmonella enterica subsp. enterica serovar Rubislaw]EDW1680386.1 glycogen synthesis protein GlgS [Salmonella enterica subsp. enterica serovar Bredeney]EEH4938981.1 glycogen synthesis protein GlgS [Salmonella enterica 
MKGMNESSAADFDFIALSIARMNHCGIKIDIKKVIGNMDEECRIMFLNRYEYYLGQLNDKE